MDAYTTWAVSSLARKDLARALALAEFWARVMRGTSQPQ
jgi:hypothetical protein